MILQLSKEETENILKNPYIEEISKEEHFQLIKEKLDLLKCEDYELLTIIVQSDEKLSQQDEFYLIRLFGKEFKRVVIKTVNQNESIDYNFYFQTSISKDKGETFRETPIIEVYTDLNEISQASLSRK